MKKPKVSVIVPCYGVEKYLDRCMESLVSQTLKDIEIILVDDGSPDRVPEMCDEWANRDSRIRVIHKHNAGLGYARNSGLEMATGEYVAFVDSDDYVDKDMYKKLLSVAVCENLDAVFCGTRREIGKGKFIYQNECTEKEVFDSKEKIAYFYLNMIASSPYIKKERLYEMAVWRGIYKKDIIKTNHISFLSEREYASEDISFNIDFLRLSSKIVLIPDVLHTYCLNLDSLTKTYCEKKFERFVKLYYLMAEQTKDVDSNLMHVNRFLIGYTRAHLMSLICSSLSLKEKLMIMKKICNSTVWENVKYNENYLPVHSAICHSLIRNKSIFVLYVYIKLLVKIKG